jgi:hypothetical protein
MAPPDSVWVNISSGNTKAMAAKDTLPREPMNQTSAMLTLACMTKAILLGVDMVTSSAKGGAVNICCERRSMNFSDD